MFSWLELENYRAFERFKLPKLARVNLLVGKNGCGKTSILEAVQFLASGGSPAVLARIARQRGEIIRAESSPEGFPGDDFRPDISHFFHGHEIDPGSYFRLKSAGCDITVGIKSVDDPSSGEPGLFDDIEDTVDEWDEQRLMLSFKGATHALAKEGSRVAVTPDGALVFRGQLFSGRRHPRVDGEVGASGQFLSPDSLEPSSMAEMWNKVIREAREREVIDALAVLDPEIDNIAFLSGEAAYRFGGRSVALVGYKGAKRRLPLGTQGEGTRRLLALSLALIQSNKGVLLVDEIDTGLHFSVMSDMWRMLVHAAVTSNVQVFATTHSEDCIKGLASMCESDAQLAKEISLQTIDPRLEESIPTDAQSLVFSQRQHIEVR